jgi:hypothetical protein
MHSINTQSHILSSHLISSHLISLVQISHMNLEKFHFISDTRKMKDIVTDQGYPYERYTVTTGIVFLFFSFIFSHIFCRLFNL